MEQLTENSLYIPGQIWENLLKDLRQRGDAIRESGAFLLGNPENDCLVNDYVCYDDLQSDCLDTGGVTLRAEAFTKLSKYASDKKKVVVADVHTHPYTNTNQSYIDKANPMVSIRGHIALIVPSFAQNQQVDLDGVGVYEYLGNYKWKICSNSDRVKIIKCPPKKLLEDNLNRLAGLFLELEPELVASENLEEEISKRLQVLTLGISFGSDCNHNIPYQAALLTAVNCGKRSFQGGISVELEKDFLCLLPGYKNRKMSTVVKSLGGRIDTSNESTKRLIIGRNFKEWQSGLILYATGWKGGCSPNTLGVPLEDSSLPIGGIFAGALGVGLSFCAASKLDQFADVFPVGMSLWEPQNPDWISAKLGPKADSFPLKVWLLGLGHLGQGYSWSLGLLPLKNKNELEALLQDYDKVVKANFESGILSETELIGKSKARVVANFLEQRNILTKIVERKYDGGFIRKDDDAKILLSGLDSSASRKSLRIGDFSAVFDIGLGGDKGSFDIIRFHNLPEAGDPQKIWEDERELVNENLRRATEKANGCGFVKGVSVSFVGAVASAFMISELLRSYHRGIKVVRLNLSLRQVNARSVVVNGNYGTELFFGKSELY